MAKPKYVIFEDDAEHLKLLVDALAKSGRACVPVQVGGDFDPESALLPEYARRVRVMFCDLHLLGSQAASDNRSHYALIAAIVAASRPGSGGPWLLIIWTEHDEEVEGLRGYLRDSVEPAQLPVAIVPLRKAEHLADPKNLPKAIDELVGSHPEVHALLDWEESVAEASAETMATLTAIGRHLDTASGNADGIRRILGFIAKASFGSRAGGDKFGAVTSVLAPLVADRIINAHKDGQRRDLWQSVVQLPEPSHDLPLEDASRLNSMLHIEEPDPAALNPRHSGTLSKFPPDLLKNEGFEPQFGPLADLWKLLQLSKENQTGVGWYLLSYRAACDDAQGRPGPVPYVIAIEGPNEVWFKGKRGNTPKSSLSDSIWRSPPYFRNDQIRRILASAYYGFSLSPENAAKLQPVFRLRDQLLSELINRLHAHGARPGIVSF